VEVWLLISISELRNSSVVALHHNIVEMWIVESLVNGPETIDLLKIVEVHPENTVIAVTVKTNLVSKLVSPEW
jgi:hypothetical protein